MWSRAVIEQNLPFGALDFERGLFGFRAGLAAGLFAKIDECHGSQSVFQSQGDNAALQNLFRCCIDLREYQVFADTTEPVAGIVCVGLLTMENAVPETAFRGFKILAELWHSS